MRSIVVHYKELALKGRNRPWFVQLLVRNLRTALRGIDVTSVRSVMGRIEIDLGPDAGFDAVTIAFGLRNLADPVQGLREMARILRPGGTAVVLEFVKPRPGLVGRAYRAYLKRGLPLIGGWISGQPQAYRYLSDTVDSYRTPAELRELADRAGWREVRYRGLTLDTVGLLSGQR